MKVFVCYYGGYEGCSPPVRVFADQQSAIAWEMGEHEDDGAEWACYDEIEIEE